MKRPGFLFFIGLALTALVAFGSVAFAQGIIYDTKKPSVLKPDANRRCPSGYNSFYPAKVEYCVKCPQDYVPIVAEDGQITCLRDKMMPKMRVPDGYQPEFHKPGPSNTCQSNQQLIDLYGHKHCIKCKTPYRYHPYYGQGRCVMCNDDEALQEISEKIMCHSCPGNSQMVGIYGEKILLCVCRGGKRFGRGPDGYGCYDYPAKP